MVDLHSHVLFDIDDGAETIEDSLDILRRAQRAGVRKMAATPHFTIGEDDVDDFLERRNARLEALKTAAKEAGIKIELKAGAEVYITDDIFDEDSLSCLTIGESRVLLSEFKYHGLRPEKFMSYVDEILERGLSVLVAHPERYSYLRKNPMLINSLISRGVLLQVNATSLFHDDDEGDFARMLVECGAAAVIGSDVHTIRSGRLRALEELSGMKEPAIDQKTRSTPDLIFENLDEIYEFEANFI